MAGTTSQTASALNCIVDDTALLAGLSDIGTENLKQWVHDGAINLFVPLNTLDKLNSLRRSPPPTNLEARQTLEWLDDVTSVTATKAAGRVELQGPDDQYQTWREVERYLLPDTPLSSAMDNVDAVADDLRGRLSFRQTSRKGATALRDASESPDGFSPESSPETTQPSLAKENGAPHRRADSKLFSNGSQSPSGTAGIPSAVQPLLNYVVWRTYHGDLTIAGSGKYILLTNNRTTQRQAQKFGVRAKMLSQLSTIVSKSGIPKQNGYASTTESLALTKEIEPQEAVDEDPDEEIVFIPAQRPGSSRGKPSAAQVMDPDHFGRTAGAGTAYTQTPARAPLPISPKAAPRGSNGPRVLSGPGATRGHNSSMRGRGQFPPRGGPTARGHGPPARGQFNGPVPLQQQFGQHQPQVQYAKPIDPDSYTRPGPATRGRGNTRRLWNPNT